VLGSEQLRAFDLQGYIVLPGVVSARQLGALEREVDDLIAGDPPPPGHQGFHFYWSPLRSGGPYLKLLLESDVLAIAESLIEPGKLDLPTQAQVALNIPPYLHRPGGPHLDGTSPPEASGRPGTFTMLAGVLLTDQEVEDAGNLWVWPGTHRSNERFFRTHGPEALLATKGYTPIELPAPRQVLGNAGDLLLAHYMLGHNMGANTSSQTRRALYFRLMRNGHRERWRDCLQNAMLEFDGVRSASSSK
jgi:hypothetical protein